jgi:hypothetical protein
MAITFTRNAKVKNPDRNVAVGSTLAEWKRLLKRGEITENLYRNYERAMRKALKQSS